MARAVDQDVIPHLLTLRTLMPQLEAPLFLPGIIIDKGKEMEKEIDIVTLMNRNLVIGECKMSSKNLFRKDFDAFVHLAKELKASKVVFACMDDWEGLIQKRAQLAKERSGVDVMLFSKKQLLSSP